MGRGPQDKIYHKLINHYIKFNIKGSSVMKVDRGYLSNCVKAMNEKGINSQETFDAYKQMDEEYFKKIAEYKKTKEEIKELPEIISQYLYNCKRKAEKKGRNHIRSDFYRELKENKEKILL